MFKKGQVLYVINDKSFNNYNNVLESLSFLGLEFSSVTSPDLKNLSNSGDEVIKDYINNLPNGTIIGKNYFSDNNVFISLPFMSSHIKMPLKTGEFFWYFVDEDKSLDSKFNKVLRIKNFWISRIHGTNISEDLNFSFYQRDFEKLENINIDKVKTTKETKEEKEGLNSLDKKNQNIKNSILKESIKPIGLEDSKVFSEENKNADMFSLTTKNIIENSSTMDKFNFKAFGRFSSKEEDLTFQGSNNTLINLGTANDRKKGSIDIVAGRGYIKNYNKTFSDENTNTFKFFVFKENDEGIPSLVQDEPLKAIIEDNENLEIIKIKNQDGYEELLKDHRYYFANNSSEKIKSIKDRVMIENDNIIENDASRIYITESENIDNSSYYQVSNLDKIIDIESSFKVDKKSLNIPSIFIKSNNIRIASRKQTKNKDDIVEEGSIRLIKESSEYENYSNILLEKDGNIYIDGKNILIGSKNRDHDSIISFFESEESEPVVLGNKLESKLKELIIELNAALNIINITIKPLGGDISANIVKIEKLSSLLKEFLSNNVKTS